MEHNLLLLCWIVGRGRNYICGEKLVFRYNVKCFKCLLGNRKGKKTTIFDEKRNKQMLMMWKCKDFVLGGFEPLWQICSKVRSSFLRVSYLKLQIFSFWKNTFLRSRKLPFSLFNIKKADFLTVSSTVNIKRTIKANDTFSFSFRVYLLWYRVHKLFYLSLLFGQWRISHNTSCWQCHSDIEVLWVNGHTSGWGMLQWGWIWPPTTCVCWPRHTWPVNTGLCLYCRNSIGDVYKYRNLT